MALPITNPRTRRKDYCWTRCPTTTSVTKGPMEGDMSQKRASLIRDWKGHAQLFSLPSQFNSQDLRSKRLCRALILTHVQPVGQ